MTAYPAGEAGQRALLPNGLRDVLPPEAAQESLAIKTLLGCFGGYGYQLVKPPLVEFEASLLEGASPKMSTRIFRVMDPVSQRMMGVRADMTMQVARVATTRLAKTPRPLRLSYAGDVLRVLGSQLSPERQFAQVGVELIGSASVAADAEVAVLAAEALAAVGVGNLSIDLMVPTLVPAVIQSAGLQGETISRLRAALDRKDAAEVAAIDSRVGATMAALLEASGPVGRAFERLSAIDLPPAALVVLEELRQVVDLIQSAQPALTITIDPVENRGFEYHTGISFSLFARSVRGELGRGGRYLAGSAREPATGFTLYMDTVLRALPEAQAGQSLYLPFGTPRGLAEQLRADGWMTIAGLEPVADSAAEARRLNCTHRLAGAHVLALAE
ncbi:MAG: ATP phosphoribosyltransferase regulatory subunit [Alphaproteobacteria bacterium]|nr:ATP phosphoribosyltransferase regulatory subunit [Alphaproteobacteria bacterium]MBU0797679.1 ATP phosphoribosyltransferase regulatory subunit [Alphaproteobacteria bacterium]MBU0887988.1 ATP phosphoribosyltransferase regulatory subunit [Alphaproteobacteria bacterium]MBU1811665.1 ATP phosphoribosyltransferase regulatory subunit [Alphaproteobacteria bacterium]MBU2090384.1 ATP phosphoribosyltransferase regulatory subunit [Alphaproteobacteria bacterium]